jgi:thiamine biosynthesis lipoprotein
VGTCDLEPEIKEAFRAFDNSLSMFNPNSILSAVNANRDTTTNAYFESMWEEAARVYALSNGAFDITVAPLVNAWGFGFKNSALPSSYQVDSLRQIVGYQKVSLENGHIKKKDPRIMLDCSAIAKGYGCDVIAKFLRSRGVKNFMVEIGGEIVTSGLNPDRLPWKVGVTKPSDDSLSTSHELQTVLNVTDMAMATSGNYRNFYYKGGKKYAHTIDPKTGFPVQHNILSATVIAKSCAEADAYATSFMVMGLEKAQKVMERRPELMAYIIYSDQNGENAVWYSPSLRNKIVE